MDAELEEKKYKIDDGEGSIESNNYSEPEEEEQHEHELILENWTDWIQRTTHYAEMQLLKAGAEGWVEGQRRRKWRWAGHVARRHDGRWSNLVLCWTPEGKRLKIGRLKRRWRDELDLILDGQKGEWIALVQLPDEWKKYENEFVKGLME